MVRALLDGSKTQTRRILKGSTEFKGSYNPDYLHVHKNAPGWSDICPYGKPGDQLWVRETWGARFSHADFGGVALHWNDLRGPLKKYRTHQNLALYAMSANGQYCGGWIPSIHMPRWASRITLEITGVRVERLQDISEDDAKAEGCERLHDDEPGYIHREDPDWKICPKCGGTRLHNAIGASGGVIFDVDCRECDSYLKRYHHLWESINGPASWDLNPWVWVVEFRRLS